MKSNNQYAYLKNKHQQEIGEFPMVYAFDQKQLEKGLQKLGLNPEDTDKIYGFGGTGFYYRKSDDEHLSEILDRHAAERKAAIADDTKGTGYIYQMFLFELSAHEYTWTEDLEETLEYLHLTYADIEANKGLQHGLNKAIKKLRRNEVFA